MVKQRRVKVKITRHLKDASPRYPHLTAPLSTAIIASSAGQVIGGKKKHDIEVMMTMTTQLTTTQSVDKGARGVFEGIQFFQWFLGRKASIELTRDQQIQQFVKDRGCSCSVHYVRCGSCKHLISDIFGDSE